MTSALNRSQLARWLGALACLAGTPAYLVADRLQLLSPPQRELPLVFLIAAVCLLMTALALRPRLPRGVTASLALVVLCNVAALPYLAKALSVLPPASAELPIGARLPEITLAASDGQPFSLRSLEGHPAVLLFFRGAT